MAAIVLAAGAMPSGGIRAADKTRAMAAWEASAREADGVPADKFREYWMKAGRAIGYPTTAPGRDDGKVTFIWADQQWFDAQFDAWNRYDNLRKLYLAGIFTHLQYQKSDRSLSAEDFKSKTMGYYQCMNTVAGLLGLFKAAGGPAQGTVQETLALCGGGGSDTRRT